MRDYERESAGLRAQLIMSAKMLRRFADNWYLPPRTRGAMVRRASSLETLAETLRELADKRARMLAEAEAIDSARRSGRITEKSTL